MAARRKLAGFVDRDQPLAVANSAALPDSVWQRLPSRADTEALLAAARKAYGVPDGVDIAAAAGTQALIQWLPHLAAPGPVAIVGPTYSEHALAWRNAGHPVIAIDSLDACPEERASMLSSSIPTIPTAASSIAPRSRRSLRS